MKSGFLQSYLDALASILGFFTFDAAQHPPVQFQTRATLRRDARCPQDEDTRDVSHWRLTELETPCADCLTNPCFL